MQDPKFAKAWKETEPEMNVIRAIVDASEVHTSPSTDKLYSGHKEIKTARLPGGRTGINPRLP